MKDEPPKVIYVKKDATGANNGVSWSDAYNSLQKGLDVAFAGDEIWVAQGIYTPTLQTVGGDPCSVTFSLIQGVALYGGFSGNEIAVHQRDWHTNQTILSGDLLGNDTNFTENRDDNCYNVVTSDTMTQSTRLDGFYIMGGHADNRCEMCLPSGFREMLDFDINGQNGLVVKENQVDSPNVSSESGGGLYSYDSNSILVNLVFTDNYAIQGGGQYAKDSNILMVDCAWIGNYAEFGGGIFITNTPMTITNGIINGNVAGTLAGGLYHYGGDSLISNSTFNNNDDKVGEEDAKSILNTANSHLEIWNSVIWGEDETNIIRNDSDSTTTLSYSLLRGGCSGIVGLTCDVVLDEDPLFMDADGEDYVIGSLDDDLRLSSNSHAVDHGDNSAVYPDTVDLDDDGDYMEPLPIDWSGEPRFIDSFMEDNGSGVPPLVDMGALESFDYLFFPVARKAGS